jgi:tripartite ATP-independent transporter DctP family solute receptor
MKKKWLPLVVMLLVLCMILTVAATSALAQYTLRLGVGPIREASAVQSAELFGNMVESMSKGHIKFQYFPGAQLGNSSQLAQMVRTGSLEATSTSTQYWTGVLPYLAALDLPYLYADALAAMLACKSPAFEQIAQDMEQFGIKVVGWTDYGGRDMGNSVKPINTAQDLIGLKWRIAPSPIFSKVWEAWGAKPIPMPMGELYTALEAGVINGVDFPASTLLDQKYAEITKYVTLTNHVTTFAAFFLNKKWFDSLPKDLQAIVLKAGDVAGDWGSLYIERARYTAVEQLQKMGVKVNTLPASESALLRAKLQPLYDSTKKNYAGTFMNLLLGK